MARALVAAAYACAVMTIAPAAFADRVALLPSRGGDAAARATLEADLAKGIVGLGHSVVPQEETSAALKARVSDGVADTQEEYRAVGATTHADWVLVAVLDRAVTTTHVEMTACLVRAGRVEAVAREIDRPKETAQAREMLAVLVRPEGVGGGALPWEQGVPATPAKPEAPPEPAAPVDGQAHVAYPAGARDVWPAYSGGKRGFVSASFGFALPVVRPPIPRGVSTNATALVGDVRGGYAVGDRGVELFADLGGDLYGPRALWLDGGLRWMFAPALRRGADGVRAGAPFFMGPEVLGGAFIELPLSAPGFSAPAAARLMVGGALDVAFAVAPSFSLEAHLGNLRWVPGGSGALLFVGADVGGTVRF